MSSFFAQYVKELIILVMPKTFKNLETKIAKLEET